MDNGYYYERHGENPDFNGWTEHLTTSDHYPDWTGQNVACNSTASEVKDEVLSNSGAIMRKPKQRVVRGSVAKPYSRPESTASAMSDSAESDSSNNKRGRASQSNSKMASYARQYREAKKLETKHFETRCKELEAENTRILAANSSLIERFDTLSKDYENLLRVLQFDSKLAPLVARVTSQQCGSSAPSELPPMDVGVCIHVGSAGTSLEVCGRCNSRAPLEAPSKGLMPETTPLFGGDFDSISDFIH